MEILQLHQALLLYQIQVGAETLTKSGTISTNSANVGSFATSSLTISSLSLSDGSGTASNYTLSGGKSFSKYNSKDCWTYR